MSARNRLRLIPAVIAILAATGLAIGEGFGPSSSPARGKALEPNIEGVWSWKHSVLPGEEWVHMSAFMWNISQEPIIIQAIEAVNGKGLGNVVEVTRIEVAPLPGVHGDGSKDESSAWTPGGTYKTYPPTASLAAGQCHTQAIAAVAGFELSPGGEARVLVGLKAIGDGSFDLDGVLVTYESEGRVQSQMLPIGMEANVSSRRGQPLLLDNAEKSCATKSQVLPSGSMGEPQR